MVTYHEEEQDKLINDLRTEEEESLTQKIASDIGVPYVDLTGMTINSDALRLIDEATARKAEMANYSMISKAIDVAVKSPTNPDTLEEINKLEKLGYSTTLHMASLRSLTKAWGRYKDLSASEGAKGGLLDISDENLQEIVANVHKDADVEARLKEIFELHDSHQISKIMETVFGSAIALGSSDVHFEPEEESTHLRLREDGILQKVAEIEPVLYQRLLNRVKFISGMKLTDTVTAQDGRFTIMYKGMEVEVRVAVAPGAYNESIVLRILNPEGLAVDFEKLGIQPKLFKVLEHEIAKPNGMILTTGPTGSGKTTTLYSFLKKIYDPGIKIITIEDPIEYHLAGITQEQVNHEKGFDFQAGLRAALRQDPDVIMVGEIRDKETATIAVNASLTGHMVFSTLHTNSAAGTIPRLIDLGIQPGILAAALTVSIAQRLLRRLCPACKKIIELPPNQKELLIKIIKNAERIGKDLSDHKITSGMPIVTYGPVGCEKCSNTGYKGRVGLFEAILTDDMISEIMVKVPPPSERDIKRAAEHQKILTMIEDGMVNIVTGETSFDEVQSTVDLAEDVEENIGMDNANMHHEEPSQTSPYPTAPRGASEHLPLAGEDHVNAINNPAEIRPNLSSNGEEVSLLIDYLKMLEAQQQATPNVGIADKVARAQHMIISILENTPDLENLFAGRDPKVAVRDEIEGLMNELKSLETDQVKNPSMGIADKIASIRNTIQSMHGEVAKQM